MAQYDINLREYWRILKKRKFVVILTAIVLGAFSTAFAILRAPTPLYTTVCIIEFEETPALRGLSPRTIEWSDSDDVETQITVIKSYAVFQKVAEKLGLISPGDTKRDGQLNEKVIRIIEDLQSKVEVTRESFTSILKIKVTDRDPAFGQKLANTIALTYREVHAEEQMRETKEALRYIDEQLKEVRKKLRVSEEEFNRFSQENELISIETQSENLLARAQGIQNDIQTLQEEKRELEGIHRRLNKFIKQPVGSNHDFYSVKASARYQSANDTLVGLLLRRDTLLKDFTPQHPEVVAISRQVIENARKMVILLKLQIGDLEKKENDLTRALGKVDRQTKVLMDKKVEFDRLKRKVELYNDMTALLEKKNQEVLIKRAEKPEKVKIVKPALLPTLPINPPKTVATGATGVLVGLVFGIVIGFVVETFDTSLGAIEDVEETLGTQVLGIIPHADAKDMAEGIRGKYPGQIDEHTIKEAVNLISHFVPKSMMAESFRALRTNIQFKDREKKTQTIAVTSTSPEEGKTLVAINLAMTMAQAGMKTLLVGSDLRKPAVHKVFGVEMSPGLTDVLLGNYAWRDTVKDVTDLIMGRMTQTQVIMTPGLDKLHIITSGPIPPNPAELIDSGHLLEFMEEAKEEYDMIIFDSPPILSTADAAILGTKVDGVLLVYRVGAVSRGLLKRSTTQLEQVKCNVMGVILNGMRPDVSPDFQDYKYYSYYYSYGEEGKERKNREQFKALARLGRKEDKQRKPEGKMSLAQRTKGPLKEWGEKMSFGRLSLTLLAVAFLVTGILWQNGIIDLPELLRAGTPPKNDHTHAAPKKENPETAVRKKLKSLSHKHKTPESAPAVRAGQAAAMSIRISSKEGHKETDRPALKEDTSSGDPGETPRLVFEKPKTPVIKRKSSSRVETPASGPPSVPEETAYHEMAPGPKKIKSYPYSLRLGSFRALEGAEKAVSFHSKKGLSPYWVKVELRDGIWFRVYTGHFEDAEQAELFKKEHGLTGAILKKTAYANLIDTYTSSVDLEKQIRSLRNHGYSPYIIKHQDGPSRLYVGTFVTREGAVRQQEDLKSSGIQSRVVQR